MSTIEELGSFLRRETEAAGSGPASPVVPSARDGEPAGNGDRQ
jgi:hypothetical protein